MKIASRFFFGVCSEMGAHVENFVDYTQQKNQPLENRVFCWRNKDNHTKSNQE